MTFLEALKVVGSVLGCASAISVVLLAILGFFRRNRTNGELDELQLEQAKNKTLSDARTELINQLREEKDRSNALSEKLSKTVDLSQVKELIAAIGDISTQNTQKLMTEISRIEQRAQERHEMTMRVQQEIADSLKDMRRPKGSISEDRP